MAPREQQHHRLVGLDPEPENAPAVAHNPRPPPRARPRAWRRICRRNSCSLALPSSSSRGGGGGASSRREIVAGVRWRSEDEAGE
nr:unnamed protein product [Digitaria exilis]